MSTLTQRGQGVNLVVLPHERPKKSATPTFKVTTATNPMKPLVARYLERKAAAAKRSETEKKHHQLTYRGVPYCRPCEIKIAYY